MNIPIKIAVIANLNQEIPLKKLGVSLGILCFIRLILLIFFFSGGGKKCVLAPIFLQKLMHTEWLSSSCHGVKLGSLCFNQGFFYVVKMNRGNHTSFLLKR